MKSTKVDLDNRRDRALVIGKALEELSPAAREAAADIADALAHSPLTATVDGATALQAFAKTLRESGS